MFRNADKTN